MTFAQSINVATAPLRQRFSNLLGHLHEGDIDDPVKHQEDAVEYAESVQERKRKEAKARSSAQSKGGS
jgi:hypothetical protein